MLLKFTKEDVDIAADVWGANCGPVALAAVAGISLDRARECMGDFERKRYTNPTLMREALIATRICHRHVRNPVSWPAFGLARIQWGGPWTKRGVPPRAAYRHTHWVGSRSAMRGTIIFDVNAMSEGGWIPLSTWDDDLVPWLLRECEPKADGTWGITHAIEVQP